MHRCIKKWALSGSLLLLSTAILSAQEFKSDTLNQVLISGLKYQKYNLGGKSITWQSDEKNTQSLNQKIAEKLPVHFISRGGSGQLSTINLRGVGSSRTSLLWNNMEINSYTLGEADYSLIPAGVAEQVTLNLGNNGALFGNGAIGGSINLASVPSFTNRNHISTALGIGSFGEKQTSINYEFGKENLNLKSSIYYYDVDNDFSFPLADSTAMQSNAAYQNIGMAHDLYFKPTGNQQISLNAWYNFNHRQVQPQVFDLNSNDQLTDRNLRLLASYSIQAGNWFNELRMGYTHDYQAFNQFQEIKTNRWYASYENEWQIRKNISWKNGANLNFLSPQVHAYEANLNEIRNDIYSSFIFSSNFGSIAANLRQPMVDGELKPFSPSIGIEVFLLERRLYNLFISGQAGRSFRLPTLNDRFWQPGGNPDLRPELSDNIEAGLHLESQRKYFTIKSSASFYHNIVDDWILWRPGGKVANENGETVAVWSPFNIKLVHATGIELFNHLHFKEVLNDLDVILNLNGTYTRAINKAPASRFDRSVNKQLRYTPEWVFNTNIAIDYDQFRFQVINQYTGIRYQEENNELPPLPAYFLTDLALNHHLTAGNIPIAIGARVNNLFNIHYENYLNRAMPGINYHLHISFNYNL